MTKEEIQPLRDKLLAPLGMRFVAPNKVSIYLVGDNLLILENFNDEAVDATFELPKLTSVSAKLTIPAEGKSVVTKSGNAINIKGLSPRTLVVMEYK